MTPFRFMSRHIVAVRSYDPGATPAGTSNDRTAVLFPAATATFRSSAAMATAVAEDPVGCSAAPMITLSGGVEQRSGVVADPGAVDAEPPVAGIGARVFESDLALRTAVDARAGKRRAEDDRGAGLDEAAAVEVVAAAGRARHARIDEEAG